MKESFNLALELAIKYGKVQVNGGNGYAKLDKDSILSLKLK